MFVLHSEYYFQMVEAFAIFFQFIFVNFMWYIIVIVSA